MKRLNKQFIEIHSLASLIEVISLLLQGSTLSKWSICFCFKENHLLSHFGDTLKYKKVEQLNYKDMMIPGSKEELLKNKQIPKKSRKT